MWYNYNVYLCKTGGGGVKKLIFVLLAAAAMCLGLAGCMETSADDLYALPELSEGYLKLQSAVDKFLSAGAEYAAPASGANRQPIQREDIDGDGVREVLAFLSVAGSDRPLKIVIFQNIDGEYSEIARIEGEGSGIESVSYLDMDGDGIRELAVGWQMGAGINMLSVYSMKSWQISQIVNTNYSEFTVCELDGERGSEVLVLRLSPSDLTGEAEHYILTRDGEVVSSTARLSSGLEAIERVRATPLLGGASSVLVESTYNGSGLVTDILAYRGSRLVNITVDEASGVSDATVRSYKPYCRDINGDGVLDVPRPVLLPSVSETPYYMLEWYSYYSYGGARQVATTYNNYTDSWYLLLPREWIGSFAVSREDGASGERTVVFSLVDGDGQRGRDFLAIYTITGDNREERASAGERFVLLEEEETVYAARIFVNPDNFPLPISRELLKDSFGVIYSEWITGQT